MQSFLRWTRQNFHPLFWLRHTRVFCWLSEHLSIMLYRRVHGRRVYVDAMRNLSFVLLPDYPEIGEFAALLRRRPAMIFWDIGANVGLYSAEFLHHCPASNVLMVEPDHRNVECLRRSFSGCPNVSLLQAAVTDRTGAILFTPDPVTGATGSIVVGDDGQSFVERHHSAISTPIKVRCTTLDDLLHQYPAPDLIKIDVEGAELLVLKGAAKVLSEHRPILVLELSQHLPDVKAMLVGLGYAFYDPATLERVDAPGFNTVAIA